MTNNKETRESEKELKNAKNEASVDTDAFRSFVDDFKQESDRAAVIVGVAKLDTLLYQILKKTLVAVPSARDEFLDVDTPIGSFGPRINLAYRIGLIDAEFARALHLFRKIRNSFAHELGSKHLELGAHGDRVRELIAPFSKSGLESFANFRRLLFKDDNTVGNNFRCVLGLAVLCLEHLLTRVEPISSEKATHFYAIG